MEAFRPKSQGEALPGSGYLGAWVVLSKGTRRGAQEECTSLHLSLEERYSQPNRALLWTLQSPKAHRSRFGDLGKKLGDIRGFTIQVSQKSHLVAH